MATTYFVPVDESEHRKGNAGHDVPDYCRNCRQPFMAHTNGECPKQASTIPSGVVKTAVTSLEQKKHRSR
jgi:hypothetical protein